MDAIASPRERAPRIFQWTDRVQPECEWREGNRWNGMVSAYHAAEVLSVYEARGGSKAMNRPYRPLRAPTEAEDKAFISRKKEIAVVGYFDFVGAA